MEDVMIDENRFRLRREDDCIWVWDERPTGEGTRNEEPILHVTTSQAKQIGEALVIIATQMPISQTTE